MFNHGPGSWTSKSLTQAAIATTVADEVINFASNESNLTEGGLEPDDQIPISSQAVCHAAAYVGLTWSDLNQIMTSTAPYDCVDHKPESDSEEERLLESGVKVASAGHGPGACLQEKPPAMMVSL